MTRPQWIPGVRGSGCVSVSVSGSVSASVNVCTFR